MAGPGWLAALSTHAPETLYLNTPSNEPSVDVRLAKVPAASAPYSSVAQVGSEQYLQVWFQTPWACAPVNGRGGGEGWACA